MEADQPAPNPWRKRIAVLAAVLFVGLFVLEIATYFLSRFNIVSIETPIYELREYGYRVNPWVLDIDARWGAWHLPDTVSRHAESCFDVSYRSNSYGARDRERSKDSLEERVIVLGDSFVEGFGVGEESRFSSLLEAKTGMPHMNFAAGGDFGPTQYYLVYKHLARDFVHSAVIVGITPSTDFAEDDPAYARTRFTNRYRPYWIGDDPDYELAYFEDGLAASELSVAAFERELVLRRKNETRTLYPFKLAFRRYSYAYNALVAVRDRLIGEGSTDPILTEDDEFPYNDPDFSGYYDFDDEALARLRHSLTLIIEEAAGRPVFLVTLPTRQDFRRYLLDDDLPLWPRIEQFCRQMGIQQVDLLAPMFHLPGEPEQFFLDCDGHWNRRGHDTAADILRRRLKLYARDKQP